MAQNGALWQDGWYLYDQGAVSGPLSASEVFQKEKTNGLLVARKGFGRWYQFEHLHEIYNPAFKQAVTPTPKVQIAIKGPLSAAPKPKRQEAPVQLNLKSFAYYHMLLRGRLRLGGIHNPWFSAFVFVPLSLGYFWYAWMQRATTEVLFHLDDPLAFKHGKRYWQAFIPGLHFLKVYRLAKLILQMEVQNRYASTKPLLAATLAVFPPLALFYLQKKMNAHWVLHVRHSASSVPAP